MGQLEWLVFGLCVPLCTFGALKLPALAARLADDPNQAPERKLQSAPVPMIGGPVLLLVGLVYIILIRFFGFSAEGGGATTWFAWPTAAALFLAFSVGLLDDLCEGGLGAGAKVLLQVAASLPLYWLGPGPSGLLLVLGGVVAMNAINTFDNADGAVVGLAAGASAFVAPGLTLALLVFLPANLGRASFGRKCYRSHREPPAAYLGDSGSHMLGMLLLLLPGAWMALYLPLLDLARVSALRWRVGQPIWVGDRQHLAHRMESSGWPPWLVAASLLGIAAPTLSLGVSWSPSSLWWGALASTCLYAISLWITRQAVAGPVSSK